MSSLLLLMGGGFLPTSVSFSGQAFSYDVTAKVSAPLPTEPAVITSPTDQQHFTAPTITVTGTCPNDSYVKVFKDGVLAGISACTGNVFTVNVTLNPGANVLEAKVYNLTDDEGPTSPSITVYYDPPTAPGTPPSTPSSPEGSTSAPGGSTKPGTPGTGSAGTGAPLKIDLLYYRYQTLPSQEMWQWDLRITGGTAPYTIAISWGDGVIDTQTAPQGAVVPITHRYAKEGIYLPFVTVTDTRGGIETLQLLATVKDTPVTLPTAESLNPWIMWPLYIGLALVVLMFWLHEISVWRRAHRKAKAHHHA
jgi:hypothetical protein